jgi:hypothetical protein
MTVTFGLDISHHQDLGLDLARCKREGIDFVFLKGTEGGNFTDPEFAANLAEARRAGLLVAAYCFVRANTSAAAHVAHVARIVPKDVPIIPDVETALDGSKPSLALTRDVIARLRAAGYRVPLSYVPRWYWRDAWGSPSLAGLPPLWSSRYPDNVVGLLADEWDDVPAHYWDGYGGLPVAVLQFTSSTRVAGYEPLDANAYRGTRAQLAALLGGQEEDDMPSLEDMLNTKLGADGNTAFDAWAKKPGTLGHWFRGQRQLAAGTRAIVTAQNAAIDKLADLLAAGDNELTADGVKAAVKTGVTEALAESTVHVDIDVTGPEGS